MILSEYKAKAKLDDKVQAEQAKYICFYQYKENGVTSFSMSDISHWFIDFGYREPLKIHSFPEDGFICRFQA